MCAVVIAPANRKWVDGGMGDLQPVDAPRRIPSHKLLAHTPVHVLDFFPQFLYTLPHSLAPFSPSLFFSALYSIRGVLRARVTLSGPAGGMDCTRALVPSFTARVERPSLI